MFYEKVNLLYLELYGCGSSDPLFDRGKEMVKEVIVVIYDGIKKSPVTFFTNNIKVEGNSV